MGYPQHFNNIIRCYNFWKCYYRLIDLCNTALELNIEDSKIYYYKGLALDHLDNVDEALILYNKAIKLDPDYKYPYKDLGENYAVKGQYEKAKQDYEVALKLDPKFKVAKKNLSRLRSRKKK